MRRAALWCIIVAGLLGGFAPGNSATGPPQQTSAVGKPALQERTPVLDRPWTADPQKFTFAILGDKWGDGAENWPIFDRAVEEINLSHPDFVMTVGDLVRGSDDSAVVDTMWAEFRRHVGRLQSPCFLVPGNHDVGNPVALDYWRRNIGRTYYSFDYKGCHFLVLNTDEEYARYPALGEQQIAFALDDLTQHRDAWHTFVFMHHPAWVEEPYPAEWQQVERALAGRKHTVFCGHWHNFKLYRNRNTGSRFFVLGPTGAGLRPSEIKEMGSFHHYTFVTVDGDSAYVSIREPGNVWREDISTPEFQEKVERIVQPEAGLPEGLDGPTAAITLVLNLENPLPDSITVTAEFAGLSPGGWRCRVGERQSMTLMPGQRGRLTAPLVVPTARLLPPPQVRHTVTYHGHTLTTIKYSLPLFPDSVWRLVPEWSIVGPFDAGEINRELVSEDPRRAMPGVYRTRGPETGWNPDAEYREGETLLKWRTVGIEHERGGVVDLAQAFGIEENKVAYALCSVYSPARRTTYALLGVNDYADVFVNGVPIRENHVITLDGGEEYVLLRLKAGWNTVMVRAINLGRAWGFRFTIADPSRELRFAPHPE